MKDSSGQQHYVIDFQGSVGTFRKDQLDSYLDQVGISHDEAFSSLSAFQRATNLIANDQSSQAWKAWSEKWGGARPEKLSELSDEQIRDFMNAEADDALTNGMLYEAWKSQRQIIGSDRKSRPPAPEEAKDLLEGELSKIWCEGHDVENCTDSPVKNDRLLEEKWWRDFEGSLGRKLTDLEKQLIKSGNYCRLMGGSGSDLASLLQCGSAQPVGDQCKPGQMGCTTISSPGDNPCPVGDLACVAGRQPGTTKRGDEDSNGAECAREDLQCQLSRGGSQPNNNSKGGGGGGAGTGNGTGTGTGTGIGTGTGTGDNPCPVGDLACLSGSQPGNTQGGDEDSNGGECAGGDLQCQLSREGSQPNNDSKGGVGGGTGTGTGTGVGINTPNQPDPTGGIQGGTGSGGNSSSEPASSDCANQFDCESNADAYVVVTRSEDGTAYGQIWFFKGSYDGKGMYEIFLEGPFADQEKAWQSGVYEFNDGKNGASFEFGECDGQACVVGSTGGLWVPLEDNSAQEGGSGTGSENGANESGGSDEADEESSSDASASSDGSEASDSEDEAVEMSCAEGVAIDDGNCSRNSAREAARRNELEALTGYQAIKDAARGGARINPDRSGELRGDNGGRTEQPGLTGDPEFGGPTSVDGGLVGPPGNTGGNIDYPDEVVIGGGPGPESNELGDAMGSPALNGSAAPSDSSETFTELCEITLSAIVPSWMGSSKAPVSGFLRVKLTNQGSSSCAPQILSLSVMRSGQRLAIESPFLGVKALQIGESYTAKLPLTLRQKGTYQLKISGYSQTDYPNFSANPNGLSNPDYSSILNLILQ